MVCPNCITSFLTANAPILASALGGIAATKMMMALQPQKSKVAKVEPIEITDFKRVQKTRKDYLRDEISDVLDD